MLRNSFKYVNYNDLRTIWKCSNRIYGTCNGKCERKCKACAADEITSDCDEDGAAVF
ncbi:MAG: hypothetical protein ACLTUL_08880 [Blautia faecis]